MSRPNDDRVIGLCDLIVERAVTERAAAIFRTSKRNLRGSLFLSIYVAVTYSPYLMGPLQNWFCGESVGIELPASHYNFIKYYDNLFL